MRGVDVCVGRVRYVHKPKPLDTFADPIVADVRNAAGAEGLRGI